MPMARLGCPAGTTPSRRRLRTTVAAMLLALILAAGFNAVMDTLSFRYDRSVFAAFPAQRPWLDPRVSWTNKWQDGDPARGEAFPLSSTALVGLTDAWHLAKSCMLLCLCAAILAPLTLALELPWAAWLGLLVGLKVLWGLVFEGLFAHLLIRS
ncbi:MAG: hypothetical protein J0M02_11680 [Planctomycetes bacterium]|nr:hypothetical protein [Planctomycetota bacterium]